MKFQAKKLDLDLELVTLSGETMTIKGPDSITAENASKAITKLRKEDDEIMKDPSKSPQITIDSLVGIYGKDAAFWSGNFDYGTLVEIRQWFTGTLMGIKKKE